MTHTLKDIPVEQLMVEHYLFDLGYPIKTVSEISGMDRESVRKIYDDRQKYETQTRRTK
nr:MAG: hypothetical protein [Bacteriophage sp.]